MNRRMRIKKVLRLGMAVTVLALSLFTAFPNLVLAKETGTITGSNVNVRQQASTSSQVVSLLTKGTSIQVLGTAKDAQGKTWYQVLIKQGTKEIQGYVIETYVNYTKTSEDTAASTKTDTTVSMNQKSQTGETADNKTASTTTSVTKKGEINTSDVNIRKKAVLGTVICKLARKTSVKIKKEVTGSDGKIWYYISFKYDGKTKKGWVRSDLVTLKEDGVSVLDAKEDVVEEVNLSAVTKVTSNTGQICVSKANVRKKAVTGAVVASLSQGTNVEITSEKKGSDQNIWYKIKFDLNGKQTSGYVRSDLVNRLIKEETTQIKLPETEPETTVVANPLTSEEFEAELTKQGFPEDYKVALREIHATHPSWVFKSVDTKLSFETVVLEESKVGRNLVAKTSIASWKSTERKAYDYLKDSWYTFDGGSWAAASSDIIRYYLDPRNFLNDTGIFQFETLEYEPYQNLEGIKSLLASSFMKGDYTEPDGTVHSYAETFLEVGKATGTSPYHLAARCYQEQGKGKSDSISGTVSGLENYFNYYNIGAYASGNNSPTRQGLMYASNTVSSAANYERPWNTRYKSILGGAQYVSQKYVKVGQNTLYFQKFNVVNKTNGLYQHQYMTNLQAADSEATKMSKAYKDQEGELVFLIPVYKDLPKERCKLPTGKGNPNNYLKELTIKNQELTPAFSPEVDTYQLTVKKSVKKITISGTSVAKTSTIDGLGTVSLKRGENKVVITCKAENGAEKVYTIVVTRK